MRVAQGRDPQARFGGPQHANQHIGGGAQGRVPCYNVGNQHAPDQRVLISGQNPEGEGGKAVMGTQPGGGAGISKAGYVEDRPEEV